MTFFSIAIPNDGDKSLTVMYENGDIESVAYNHPNFDKIVDLLNSGESTDESVQNLINTNKAVGMKMAKVSERISVAPWGVFFDGDPLRGELSDTIVRMYNNGEEESLKTLVLFMEKASSNPSMSSVDALYRWITQENLTITDTGDFIGYKGVRVREDGSFESVYGGDSPWIGKAFVDGVEHIGRTPYPVGSVIEMPRSEVDPESQHYCATGLHVGTWDYAYSYGSTDGRSMISVQVNPRDVVMVPEDSNEKMRVCRYIILGPIQSKVSMSVVKSKDPTDNLTWKKGQLVRLTTNQGHARVFAPQASTGEQSWLNSDHVSEVFDVFENGRNSKGHFVKGFAPTGMVRLADGRWGKI